MWRAIASITAALVAWIIIATLLNFILRAALPGYHGAEATLQFTLAMKIGRLTIAALTSIASGAVARMIAPSKPWTVWAVGLILLALFVPEHARIWSKFPFWYHLTFLLTLAPLVALGGELVSGRNRQGFAHG
jgi:hypothetical protein